MTMTDDATYVPTSQIFARLLDEAPASHVTLEFLLQTLGERSFGVLLLLLGLLGVIPGVATVAAILLLVPAAQMIMGRSLPTLPRFLLDRRIPTARLAWLLARAIPVLRWFERFTYPRWQTPFRATRRVVGVAVLLLALTLLSPIPLLNLVPDAVIILIAFAWLEKDGVLLAAALFLTLASLAITTALVWATIVVPGQL